MKSILYGIGKVISVSFLVVYQNVLVSHVQEKHVNFYFKTETMTRKVKVFYLGRNLFKCTATVKRFMYGGSVSTRVCFGAS